MIMIRKTCSFFLLMSLLWSCDSMQSKNKKNIPESIGSENNIIVVTDSSVWTSGIKDLLSDNFEKNYPVLNQPEPYFKLLDIKFVELNSLLKRSKIIFFISDLSKKSRLSSFVKQAIGDKGIEAMTNNNNYVSLSLKEYWAKPQLIIFCAGKTKKLLLEGIEKEKLRLFEKVAHFEKVLMKKRYEKIKSTKEYIKMIETRFDMSLNMPRSFNISMNTDSFICFTKEIESGYMGIALYTTTYKDTSQFNTKNIIATRDRFLGKHIQGEFDNTPMVTEKKVSTIDKSFYLDSSFAKVTRGLWRLSNEYMGGPFINQTIYNKRSGQLIHIDGFIYAPGKAKKKYLKEIETILSGIKI